MSGPVEGVASTAVLRIVNPVAQPSSAGTDGSSAPAAARPGTLDAKTVGLYWNGKQNGPHALARTRDLLAERYSGIRFVDVIGELGGTNRYLSPGQLDTLSRTVDVVVATSADCGSCTSWLMRDLCELERRGIPAVGYTAEIFGEDARFSIETFGVPDACPVIVPECFSNKTADEIAKMVEAAMPSVIECLTADRAAPGDPPAFDNMVLEAAPELIFEGSDLLEAFDRLTGVPLLLNTSFNIKGEPIVETPADAINCFLGTGIDFLILGDVLMKKKPTYRVVRPVASFFSEVGDLVRATLSMEGAVTRNQVSAIRYQ
jgi:hypothetical protein